MALDVETYGSGKDALNPFRGEIRLLTLAIPDHIWLIDLKAVGYDLGPLKPALGASLIVGHNIKFDLLWLLVKCGMRVQRTFCTMTAARLLHAGTNYPCGLGGVVDHYLEIKLNKDLSRSDWGRDQLTPDQIKYSVADVAHLHRLKSVLEAELEEAGLTKVACLEMDLLPVVVDMESAGFAVDRARLEMLLADAKREARAAETEVKVILKNPTINFEQSGPGDRCLGRDGHRSCGYKSGDAGGA